MDKQRGQASLQCAVLILIMALVVTVLYHFGEPIVADLIAQRCPIGII